MAFAITMPPFLAVSAELAAGVSLGTLSNPYADPSAVGYQEALNAYARLVQQKTPPAFLGIERFIPNIQMSVENRVGESSKPAVRNSFKVSSGNEEKAVESTHWLKGFVLVEGRDKPVVVEGQDRLIAFLDKLELPPKLKTRLRWALVQLGTDAVHAGVQLHFRSDFIQWAFGPSPFTGSLLGVIPLFEQHREWMAKWKERGIPEDLLWRWTSHWLLDMHDREDIEDGWCWIITLRHKQVKELAKFWQKGHPALKNLIGNIHFIASWAERNLAYRISLGQLNAFFERLRTLGINPESHPKVSPFFNQQGESPSIFDFEHLSRDTEFFKVVKAAYTAKSGEEFSQLMEILWSER